VFCVPGHAEGGRGNFRGICHAPPIINFSRMSRMGIIAETENGERLIQLRKARQGRCRPPGFASRVA
jgi:hypothetical protein